METARRNRARSTRRGRPRTHEQSAGLVRRNLLVDPDALEQLCALYEATSDSAAVRRAIDLALLAHEAEVLAERLAERGSPDDAYGPPPPLPVYLRPESHGGTDEDDDPDLAQSYPRPLGLAH